MSFNSASKTVGEEFARADVLQMRKPAHKKKAVVKTLYSNDFEQSVLCSIIINSDKLRIAKSLLVPQDFYIPENREIYQSILDLEEADSPIELTTINNKLNGKGGGKKYLMAIATAHSTPSSIRHYVEEVKELSEKRKLLDIIIKTQKELVSRPFQDVLLDHKSAIQKERDPYWLPAKTFISAKELLNITYEKSPDIIGRGLLPEGGGLIIGGDTGVGKSLIRTEMAIHLIMGWEIWGLKIPTTRSVFIFQFENPQSTEQYRLKQMLKALNISSFPDKLLFSDPTIRFNLSLKGDRQKLYEVVKESGCEVVIYDPLSSMHNENENDNVKMRTILDSFTEINHKAKTSCMVLHHYGKPNPDRPAGFQLRGASSIKDWADTVLGFEIKKHEHMTLREIRFIKVRNGPWHKPILLVRDKDSFLHDVIEEDTLCPPLKVREILEDIGGKADSKKILIDAIVERIGCVKRSAGKFINAAVKRGSILEIDHGAGKGKGKEFEISE